MGASMFSGSSQRRQAMYTAQQQQEELNTQKAIAEDAQSAALQSGLARDTNRLLRVFGSKSLQSSGVRLPTAA